MTTAPVPQAEAIGVEQLYPRYSSYVRNFLRRIGIVEFFLDDAIQDVFLVAHKMGGFVPGTAQPRTWLCSIALRVAANSRRNTTSVIKKEGDYAGIIHHYRKGYTPEDTAAYRSELIRANQMLNQLSDTHRAVFLAFNVNENTCEEIAENTNVPVGTVYSRLHTARKNFKTIIDDAS